MTTTQRALCLFGMLLVGSTLACGGVVKLRHDEVIAGAGAGGGDAGTFSVGGSPGAATGNSGGSLNVTGGGGNFAAEYISCYGKSGSAAVGGNQGMSSTGGSGGSGHAGNPGMSSTGGAAAGSGHAGMSSGGSGGGSSAGAPGDEDAYIGGGVEPRQGLLAYDADPEGAGRSIYVTSIHAPDCTQRITSSRIQAKHPAFSPDGSMLAYAACLRGKYEIRVLHIPTGAVEVLASSWGGTFPAFSPDSRTLAYISGDPETFQGNLDAAPGNLMLVDLASRTERLLSSASDQGSNEQFSAPAFVSASEVLVSTGTRMLGVNVDDGEGRDVVPLTNRLPLPKDPAPGPDGVRYAFSDHCGSAAGFQLFVGRVDGSTGDTCQAALGIAPEYSLVAADWGRHGYIAAELANRPRGIVLIEDSDFSSSLLELNAAARNPAWSPESLELAIACD